MPALLAAAFLHAPGLAAGGFGGTASNFISGNVIVDLFYSPSDSHLYVLTGSGLSYAKIDPGALPAPVWSNFGNEVFQKDFYFGTVAASDSTVILAGYTKKDDNIRGGAVYYKSRGQAAFQKYDPEFKDDEHLRGPYYVHIMDSTVYISLITGAMLKNRVPPSPSLWTTVLINATLTFQELIEDEDSLRLRLGRVKDSLDLFATLALPDRALFMRFDTLLSADSLFGELHGHSVAGDTDSVHIRWESFSLDSAKLVRDTLALGGVPADIGPFLDSLRNTVIPPSITALSDYIDTLWHRYDTITAEIPPGEYPPASYGDAMVYQFYILSIASRDSLLFLGTSGGLVVSADHNKTFKGGFLGEKGSPLLRKDKSVQGVGEVYIQNAAGDSFRVWLLTYSDTVAFSGSLENSAADSTHLEPLHADSLRKWYVLNAGYNPSDLAFFRDTVFVAYGLSGAGGLRKYYRSDTLSIDTAAKDTSPVDRWKYKSVSLTNFLEPQLGINVLQIVPVDSVSCEIWAGTDDGLYRLSPGAKAWEYFEYKRPFEKVHGETYAYPTVIFPGYKSTKIAYRLGKDANVTIEIFDFSMRRVKTLVKNRPRKADDVRSDVSIEDRWDGRDDLGRPVMPGVYYYKVSAGSKTMFGKIMVFGAKDY